MHKWPAKKSALKLTVSAAPPRLLVPTRRSDDALAVKTERHALLRLRAVLQTTAPKPTATAAADAQQPRVRRQAPTMASSQPALAVQGGRRGKQPAVAAAAPPAAASSSSSSTAGPKSVVPAASPSRKRTRGAAG